MQRDPNDTDPETPASKEGGGKALPSATDVRGFKMSPSGTALGLGRPAPPAPTAGNETPTANTSRPVTADMPIDDVLRGFGAQQGDVPKVVTSSSEGHRAAAYQGAHAVKAGQDTLRPERPVIVDVPTDPIARPREVVAPEETPPLPRTRGRLIVAGIVAFAAVILLVAIGRWMTSSQDVPASHASVTSTPSAAPSPLMPTTVLPSAAPPAPSAPPSAPAASASSPPPAPKPAPVDPQTRPSKPVAPPAATPKPADIDVLRENMKP